MTNRYAVGTVLSPWYLRAERKHGAPRHDAPRSRGKKHTHTHTHTRRVYVPKKQSMINEQTVYLDNTTFINSNEAILFGHSSQDYRILCSRSIDVFPCDSVRTMRFPHHLAKETRKRFKTRKNSE